MEREREKAVRLESEGKASTSSLLIQKDSIFFNFSPGWYTQVSWKTESKRVIRLCPPFSRCPISLLMTMNVPPTKSFLLFFVSQTRIYNCMCSYDHAHTLMLLQQSRRMYTSILVSESFRLTLSSSSREDRHGCRLRWRLDNQLMHFIVQEIHCRVIKIDGHLFAFHSTGRIIISYGYAHALYYRDMLSDPVIHSMSWISNWNLFPF